MVSFTIVEPPLAENGISSALRAVFAFISATWLFVRISGLPRVSHSDYCDFHMHLTRTFTICLTLC